MHLCPPPDYDEMNDICTPKFFIKLILAIFYLKSISIRLVAKSGIGASLDYLQYHYSEHRRVTEGSLNAKNYSYFLSLLTNIFVYTPQATSERVFGIGDQVVNSRSRCGCLKPHKVNNLIFLAKNCSVLKREPENSTISKESSRHKLQY